MWPLKIYNMNEISKLTLLSNNGPHRTLLSPQNSSGMVKKTSTHVVLDGLMVSYESFHEHEWVDGLRNSGNFFTDNSVKNIPYEIHCNL